jgi:hypothetical protein
MWPTWDQLLTSPDPSHYISQWNPSLSQLPDSCPPIELTADPSGGYTWQQYFYSTYQPGITMVQVAPPINYDLPYQLTAGLGATPLDFEGAYTSSLDYHADGSGRMQNYVALHFDSPGVYTMQVTFSDNSRTVEFFDCGSNWGIGTNDLSGLAVARQIETPIAGEPGFGTTVTPLATGQVSKAAVSTSLPKADFISISDGNAAGVFDNGYLRGAINTILPNQNIPWKAASSELATRVNVNQAYLDKVRVYPGTVLNTTLIAHCWNREELLLGRDSLVGQNANEQDFSSNLQGKIGTPYLWSCYLGAGASMSRGGIAWNLAHDLHKPGGPSTQVWGYTGVISQIPPIIRGDGKFRPAHYTYDTNGHGVSLILAG